jgi:hypothetical protein
VSDAELLEWQTTDDMTEEQKSSIGAREEIMGFAIERVCTGRTSRERSVQSGIRYALHQLQDNSEYDTITMVDLKRNAEPTAVKMYLAEVLTICKDAEKRFCKTM